MVPIQMLTTREQALVQVELPQLPPLWAGGQMLDLPIGQTGRLRDSSPVMADVVLLHERMAREGYLFFRGHLDREEVLGVRSEVMARLAASGQLAAGTDPMDAVAAADYAKRLSPELATENAPLDQLLYGGAMMEFFARFLGGPVLHFDYTWFRAIGPGKGTPSHCDSVYMGRGTEQLFTAWTPMGDIPLEMGGLMMLEGSNNNQRLRETYCKSDVDTYCTNRKGKAGQDAWSKNSGALTQNPSQLAKVLGGRWLTDEFRAGDVLIFSIFTVHASCDNRTNRIRLSSDSRYQRAGEAVDPRWIGPNPIRHSAAAKKGRIC